MTLKLQLQQLRNWILPSLWVLAGILLTNHYVSITTNITLKNNTLIDITQVFSADKMQFSEWRSRKRYDLSGKSPQVMTFNLPIQNENCLRIDPSIVIGEIRLISIEFSTPFNTYMLQADEIYDLFQPVHHIEKWRFDADGVVVNTAGNDSQLVTCQLDPSAIAQLNKDIFKMKGLIFFLILTLGLLDGWLCASTRFISAINNSGHLVHMMILISLLVVLFLVCHVAVMSNYNMHPDERMHNLAAIYYENHWLPPNLDDPAVQLLYLKSRWGVSYLSHLDFSYLFATKFRNLIRTIVQERYMGLRIFNIAFLFTMITIAYALGQQRILTILLISPQIWYLFSYFNGDAFPLGLSIIAGAILLKIRDYEVFSKSIFAESDKIIPLIFGLGTVIGLLALAKRNYLLFIGFLLLYFVWRIIFTSSDKRKRLSFILISSTLIGLTLFFVTKSVDIHINGTQKKMKIAKLAEKYAMPEYKPSLLSSNESAKYFHLRDKGIPFEKVLLDESWYKSTFKSLWGTYGHMVISAPPLYYTTVSLFVALFLCLFLFNFLFSMNTEDRLLALIVAGFIILTVFASNYHSWTYDYQPQGRYLFPAVGMIAIGFNHLAKYFSHRHVIALIGTFYLLSLYSFTSIGIANFN